MRRAAMTLTVVGAIVVAWTGSGASPGGASCVPRVTYLGALFMGVNEIDPGQLGRPAGPGVVPACNDTPGLPSNAQPTPVTVYRLRGVAPRLGVAVPSPAGPTRLMVLSHGPCPIGLALACLRRETKRLLRGPSLIAPPSAEAGAVVRVAVRTRDPRLRRRAVTGLETRLEQRSNGRWRPIFHLLHPLPGFPDAPIPDPVRVGTRGFVVLTIGLGLNRSHPMRLPHVTPGQYRLVKDWNAFGRRHTAVATITIRPPAPPRPHCPPCAGG